MQKKSQLTANGSFVTPKQDKVGTRTKRKPMFDQTGNNLLNGVKLTFQRGFGYEQNPDINSTSHCIDDNKVVYLLGKQIIQYDMLTESQKVIDSIDQEQQITTFLYFKNLMLEDNILYAVHAMNKTYPSIVARNYSKNVTQKYVMAHLEKEEKIISALLISQNRYIVALSELQGTFRISYIDVLTKQIMATQSIYFKVSGMFVPEGNLKSILMYTVNQLYLIPFGQEIKPTALSMGKHLQPNQQIVQAISSIFTNNDTQIYMITNKGNLHFVNINSSFNKISSIQTIFLGSFETVDQQGKLIIKPRMPSSICCNQYNIVIGYHFIQQFSLLKISPIPSQKPSIHKITFSCPNLHKIVRMQFAHQTMSICVIVQVKENDRFDLTIPIQSDYLKDKEVGIKQQVNHLAAPGKVFPIIFNMLLHDTLVETLRSPIQSILGSMLFVKQIVDIAILPTKKIMLILSKQRKIKAVRYEHLGSTSFQRMLIWEMHFNQNDFPSSMDIHPLTFNVAVGFKEGLKLFTISSQGLKTNNIQFPLKNCQSVRYSKFGHKLIGGSSNQIIVINPYQNVILSTISLPSGYNTKQLLFIDRDMYIFSQFLNGSSMVLSHQGNRIFQVWKKQSKMICSVYDSVFDIMVVSYEENFTKFYREKGNQEFGVLWTYPFNVTKLLVANQLGTIFMGTSLGKIRAYQWPFTDMMRFSKSFTQIQLHSAPITKLKIIPDFSLIVSGAEDGSIFISKINAYSDGIAVTDSQIMHSLKSANKNFTNLFYLQNYMITSSAIEFGHEQTIVQLQSDKAEFQTEQSEIILGIQSSTDEKLRQQQKNRQQQFQSQLKGRESQIQSLNQNKISLRQKIHQFQNKKSKQQEQMQQVKLSAMRKLYIQSDQLKQTKQELQQKCHLQISKLKQKYVKQYNSYFKQLRLKQEQFIKEIQNVQRDFNQSSINYQQLIKEQNQEGLIYKNRMLQELDSQFQQEKEDGQKLRKNYNKIRHDNLQFQDKLKHFQQLITQIQIDSQANNYRHKQLCLQQCFLQQKLLQKDKTILQQQRLVKQLLSKNINNYTQQQYLKHKQQQLLQKVKFLQKQIQSLDQKYNTFQVDFVQVTNQTNNLNQNIQMANGRIEDLKSRDKALKQEAYVKKYKNDEIYNNVYQAFRNANCDRNQFVQKAQQIFTDINHQQDTNFTNTFSIQPLAESSQQKTDKRDHLIKQVVNTNNLRKIDDTIRRTIMIKLNRQTVSLTCEVNELRKEKKKYTAKVRQLKHYIQQLSDYTVQKQNLSRSQSGKLVDDIVPANISIIRTKPSKHTNSISSSRQHLLPFQIYHNNKQISKHSHSKNYSKDLDETTQLPSMLPSILKNGSICQESQLFNIAEIDM